MRRRQLVRSSNAMPEASALCRCNRSLGVISAIFASLAVLALIAHDRCMESGGRVSDVAWICEASSGGSVSVWTLVSPLAIAAVALGVGIPVYFGVSALVRRYL